MALPTGATLTAQGMSLMCLFVLLILRPELVRRSGALPMVAAVTAQGGAGFKDAATTIRIRNLITSLYGFLT